MSSAATEGSRTAAVTDSLNSDRLELTRCTKRTASSASPISMRPGDGVQPVAELVRLRPQGVGDVPGEVELPAQLQQLRAVAQRRHRADRPTAAGDRQPVEDQHPPGAGDRPVTLDLAG